MGRVSHHIFVIVVDDCYGPTTSQRVYDKALELWAAISTGAKPLMSAEGTNGDRTIMCPADGGQSSKGPSAEGDTARDALIAWLEKHASELGYPFWAVVAMNENYGRYIDRLSQLELLWKQRRAPYGDPWLQSETGKYWGQRLAELQQNNPGGHTAASKKIGW